MALYRFAREFDPVSGLLTLQRELERAFNRPLGSDQSPSGRGAFPPVNVFSDDNGYVIRMEVPGIPPEELDIQTHGRTLSVSGARKVEGPEGASFHRHERGSGRFARSLQLPDDLDVTAAQATCKHGVLTIRVPKKAEAKPRQIAVKAA